jgi:hypothetical protein
MKIILGAFVRATQKSALVSFSPSPTYFEVKLEALILKKVHFASEAKAFAIIVFPGGQKKRTPFEGSLNPTNSSG